MGFDFNFFYEGQKIHHDIVHDMVKIGVIHSGMFFLMDVLIQALMPFRPKSRTLNLTSISQELQDCSTSKWNDGETGETPKIWRPLHSTGPLGQSSVFLK